MAIPIGTTSRHLSASARWVLAVVVMVVMLAGWWPGLAGWGVVITALLGVLAIWLMQHIVSGQRVLPTQAGMWALIPPAAILVGHFVNHNLIKYGGSPPRWAGALDLSMVTHLALLATAVMLCQSLLPKAAGHAGVLAACGAAMMGGAAAGILTGAAEREVMRPTLALLGLAGAGVWLSPLWGVGRINEPPETSHPLRHPALRVAVIVVAVAACACFAYASPGAATAAAGIGAAALLIGGRVFEPHRRGLLAGGLGLAIAAGVGAGTLGVGVGSLPLAQAGPVGLGERAFGRVSAASSGAEVLLWSVGWIGAISLVGGLTVAWVWSLAAAGRKRTGDAGRAIVWATTSALAVVALLSAGGLFVPATLMGVGLTWGMMPRMLGRPRRIRRGTVLLLIMAALLIAVGVARSTGLIGWAIEHVSSGTSVQVWLHVVAGFLLALMLAWLLAGRNGWWGLAGIALSLAAGGAGEMMQWMLSPSRLAEWSDWIVHAAGCGAAMVLFGLCRAARWCESADAPPSRDVFEAYRL
ncbi:MAG: hypothetical protein ACYTFO_00420 [Planctomycetota bacterium]|jgi:hypothetical protein